MGLFSKKSKEPKPIGTVTHFFGGLGVAIVKFSKVVTKGDRVRFRGATTDFEQGIDSLQYDHRVIDKAKKNQEVGIKVKNKVREGDEIYSVE